MSLNSALENGLVDMISTSSQWRPRRPNPRAPSPANAPLIVIPAAPNKIHEAFSTENSSQTLSSNLAQGRPARAER